MKKLISLFIVVLMLAPLLPMLHTTTAQEPQLVNTITIKRIVDDESALGSLVAGTTDGRLFRFKNIETVNTLTSAGFQALKSLSGLVNILVNPYNGTCDDHPNLFSNRKARFALQFLLDRNAIVNNIYQGQAVPAVIPWSPYDPDYPYLIGTALKWDAVISAQGAAYGQQLLEEALQELGATKEGDQWKWSDGTPVTVKFVIRIEDNRYDIGNQLADTLESIGIQVDRIYKDFRAAFGIVYADDPANCGWQLYTEGWGFTGLTMYDYGNFVWFYSSIWGGMPGWGEEGWWWYQNATIDEIAAKLDSGNYTNESEFWSLVNQGVDLGIQESVRVFVAFTFDFYIASPALSGFIISPKAQPWNTYTWLNLHKEGGDTAVFSNRYVYSEGWVWNPVGGFQDFYSRPVYDAVTWPGVTSRITDGLPGWSPGNHVVWTLERGPVDVPADALKYDPDQHAFVQVGDGVTAKNAVTFNYTLLGTIKFHDGTTETVADLFAPLYVIFEYAFDSSTNDTVDNRSETSLYNDYYTFITTFKGIKLNGDGTVTVYTDYDNMNDGLVASAASVWTSFPLELYAAMDLAARQHIYTFTDSSAEAYGVPQLHLISDDQVATLVDLIQGVRDTPPDWVQQLIDLGLLTLDEWQQRVDNLVAFANDYGHLLIGNGPFKITSYDATNDVVTLERITDFPITPDQIASELSPKQISISVVHEDLANNTAGSLVAKVEVTVDGAPAEEGDARVFVVLVNLEDYSSTMLNIEYNGSGTFLASLPTDLPEGQYAIAVLAYPTGFSVPDSYSGVLTLQYIPPPTTGGEEPVQPPEEQPQTPEENQTPEETPTPTTNETTNETGGEEGGGVSGTTIAIAVVILLIIIGAAYFFMRK